MGTVIFRKPFLKRNLFLSTKPYYLVRDRDSGEQDLARLVDSAHVEGCWLFTPDNNHWYNIGYETLSETEGDGSRTIGILTYNLDLTQFGFTLTHYHIHPRSFEEGYFAHLMSDFNEKTEAEQSELENKISPSFEDLARKVSAVSVSTPSVEDIKAYGQIVEENPRCELDFRIASQYGLITTTFRDNAETEPAEEKYVQVHKEYVESAVDGVCEAEAISLMIDKLNQHMNGLLTFEMDFREKS